MPDGADAVTIEVLSSIHDVPAAAWDACAGSDDPFTSHAFLAALEDSGSVRAETGWLPRHLAVTAADGTLVGCMPLYLKSHSYGEYVFDWGWAEAYQRAGGRYYPKLQGAVPFTPVTGRRLLLRPDAPAGTFRALATAAVRIAERLGVSSLHITFPTEQEIAALEPHGFLVRLGHQYHWENRGYSSFDDFLADLASRKRKAIRKERQAVAASGIGLRMLNGSDIEQRHWDAFYRFYLDTAGRKWGNPYLNREFFCRLGETMADRVVLVMAETGAGELVGGALNLLGADALYGRYWGCVEFLPLSALRGVLLSGDRLCDRTRARACRGRSAGRAQGAARLSTAADVEHALDRASRTVWNAMIDRRPALAVRCMGAADVIRSIRFARKHDLALAVRGGGHNIAGNAVCDGGLLVDLSPMRSVWVDAMSGRARVGPGATLGDFDREAQAFGWATPLGIEIVVVTADSELLRASENDNPDLFWALRGGAATSASSPPSSSACIELDPTCCRG